MKKLKLRKAMDIYYTSKLAKQIAEGMCGIENLSPKYLAEDLIENEPELFIECELEVSEQNIVDGKVKDAKSSLEAMKQKYNN